MNSEAYHCPYCNHDATLVENRNINAVNTIFEIESKYGVKIGVQTIIRTCPNPKCKGISIESYLFDPVKYSTVFYSTNNHYISTFCPDGKCPEKSVLLSLPSIPSSCAKPMPDYIPKQLIQDYEEACQIKELSPKASATLARRCLQGMIRDFWEVDISSNKLFDEIESIKEKVDPIIWKAIDSVRKIGNIGAHMERDVDIILAVDPGESEKLIWLLELLFKEWYIHRHEREERLKEILDIATEKEKTKKENFCK